MPVICTSAGRALLFDHDLPTLEKLVGSASFAGLGPGAPSDVAELYRRIEAGRDRGYATVDEEFEDGLVGVVGRVGVSGFAVCEDGAGVGTVRCQLDGHDEAGSVVMFRAVEAAFAFGAAGQWNPGVLLGIAEGDVERDVAGELNRLAGA